MKVAWKRGKVGSKAADRAEARRIRVSAANRRNGARWPVALSLGIRQSEAIGLRWRYVDLDAGMAEVGWQFQQPATGTAARKGVKAGQSKAKLILALPAPLVAELRTRREQQAAERAAAGSAAARPGSGLLHAGRSTHRLAL